LARVLAQAPRVPVLIFGFELGVIGGWLKLAWACENPIIYREGNNPWFQVSRRRRWLYGALIGWVDGCIAQGGYVRSQLRRLGVAGQPIEVIANPLPRSAPVQDGDRQPTPVFMAAGRLVPEKGFQRLLDGFSALESTYPNRRLIIAGAGPESCRLHEYAGRLALGQRVEFCGFIEQLQPLYQGADLFVLPSRHEGQPNVLLEALLAGCRVLAAGGEPVRDLLTEIGLPECWISSERFVEHFVQRVPLVLALPAERWRAARLRLQEMTDLAIVAQRYWAFCQALAEARRERVTA
jgi:glycosyltransferase involved in cell wall biosynthesis